MPLSSDLAIDYVHGILSYVGGFTNGVPDSVYDMNAVYSYLMDVFDEPGQLDDPSPMDGLTPTNYEVLYPWFIDPTSVKAFYGGAIESNGWTKFGTEDTSNIGGFGITKLTYTGDGAPGQGSDGFADKGTVLTGGTSGATGEILWADNASDVVYVRNTSATQFDDTTPENVTGGSWDFDLDSGTGAESGENLWSNLYSLAQIKNDTDIYILQDDTKLTSWWLDAETDHLDVLVLVKEMGTLIDSGRVTVFARQANTLYDHFTASLSGGGRNPAPLATAVDLNNDTGWRTIATGAHSGAFTVGEVITGGTSGAKGILTSYVTDTSIQYYLVGKDLTDFQSGELITGESSTESATSSGGPANYGPALSTATLAFGAVSYDLNNGNGSRPYSITIDCNAETLATVYEYLKWITRRGSTTQLGVSGSQEDGEQYIGNVVRLKTGTPAPGAFTEGATLTDQTSGATGIIVAYHSSPEDIVILSNVRGTFGATNTVNDGTNSASIDAGGVGTIAPTKQSPFGTFAGGTFFGAPGVRVIDLDSGDIKAYQLIDDLGVTQNPPNEIAVAISGLTAGDRGGIFRRDGSTGPIEKDRLLGTAQSAGANTVVAGSAIASDEPAAGFVKVIDKSDPEEPEALLRYTSWTSATFTLATDAGSGSATAGSSGNALEDTAADFGVTDDVKVGDTIYNSTTGEWGFVVSIDGVNDLTTVSAPGQTLTWTSGDNYALNVLPFATTTSDWIYIPFVAQVATASSVSNTYIYSADVYGRFVFRLKGFKPFSSDQLIQSNGLSVAAVRTTDAVVN
jgi:hypothetical protein